jgi:hypothetical protein
MVTWVIRELKNNVLDQEKSMEIISQNVIRCCLLYLEFASKLKYCSIHLE